MCNVVPKQRTRVQRCNALWVLVFMLLCGSSAIARPTLSFGGILTSLEYKEDLIAPQKSNESGILPGLEVAFSSALMIPGVRGTTKALIMPQVKSQYDGSVLQTGQSIRYTNDHTFIDVESSLVYRFAQTDDQFGILAGLRYSYWNRFLGYGSGYREIYQKYYLLLGVQYSPHGLLAKEGWLLGANLLLLQSANVDVIFSETISTGQDQSFKMGLTTGTQLFTKYSFAQRWSLSGQLEMTSLGDSAFQFNSTPGLNSQIHVPASSTTRISLGLSFEIDL